MARCSEATQLPLPMVPAGLAGGMGEEACVVMVRSLPEFQTWLRDATPAVQWLQVGEMLGVAEAWAAAARGHGGVALDVMMSDPASEYPLLYRLVEVRNARDVRVTIPLRRGFLKALRLATALQLPVRLLPEQPDRETLAELAEALDFYLHDPMIDVPIEFFHSALGWCGGGPAADLWLALERHPAVFPQLDEDGNPVLPARWPGVTADAFVEDHLSRLDRDHAECATCGWRGFCRGYFKLPDPGYSCAGIIALFDHLGDAAGRIAAELEDSGRKPDKGEAVIT